MRNNPRIGFLFRIDWSQTDHDTVLVVGCKTHDEALVVAKASCNCSRVYGNGTVDKVLDKHGNKV